LVVRPETSCRMALLGRRGVALGLPFPLRRMNTLFSFGKLLPL
jgi:hypothetical protein